MTAPTASPTPPTVVVGLSSSALFDTRESDQVYRTQPLGKYVEHQVARESTPFPKGTAFPLAEVMMNLNGKRKPFEIVVMSKNEPEAGNRVMKSLAHYGFQNVRAAFTGGEPIAQYCEGLKVSLFLSREPREVKRALKNGIAAGRLYDPPDTVDVERGQLRIAFDFDGVLASLEAEKVYQECKPDLEPYRKHEVAKAHIPLPPGPLFPVLKQLAAIKTEMTAERQALFPADKAPDAKAFAAAVQLDVALIERVIAAGPADKAIFLAMDEGRLEDAKFTSEEATKIAKAVRAYFSPIEIALVTARNPPVEARLMHTLRSWGIHEDQLFLMGGLPKQPILKQFRPHIFFDDQEAHTDKARSTVAAGLVPWIEELPLAAAASVGTSQEAGPATNIPASVSSDKSVTFVSAADFESECRKIFQPYMVAGGAKPKILDKRFRDFISENAGRPGAERAAVLERLKAYALTGATADHEPKLGRSRRDDLVRRLARIADLSAKQPQAEFNLPGTEVT